MKKRWRGRADGHTADVEANRRASTLALPGGSHIRGPEEFRMGRKLERQKV